MHTITVTYQGDLNSEATHLPSGNRLTTDAPKDNHGKGESFSPTDLLCTSLATCMFSIMGILARRKEWIISGSRAEVTKIMAENPRRVAEVNIVFYMTGTRLSASEQKMIENAALTCPVALSLHPEVKQTVKFNFSH